MSIETYENMLETTHIDTAIKDAEKEYAAEGVFVRCKRSSFMFTEETFWINIP